MGRAASLFLALAGLIVPSYGFVIRRPVGQHGSWQKGWRRWATTLPEVAWEEKLDSLLENAVEAAQSQEPGVTFRDQDQLVVEYLDGLKNRGVLSYWNSTRLSPYRVSRTDVKIYTRMPDAMERTLGFTTSPIVERIEAGMALVMAFTVGSSILALDKFPGPDIVRWFATAALVSTPFVYIGVGLSFPDALIRAVNQVLFYANKDYKERLYRHEAGHFLVGYMCGLPILEYDVGARMSAVQFARVFAAYEQDPLLQGPLPREAAMELERKKKAGLLTDDDMSRLTVVSMAGVVSEYIRFGTAEGGYDDLVQLEVLQTLQNPYMSEREAEEQVNWGTLIAYSILKNNEKALAALVSAFERGASVVDCIRVIEETADG